MTAIPAQPASVAIERTECSHCGLPVPPSLVNDHAEEQFCCNACSLAYSVLHEAKLDQYYELRKKFEATPSPSSSTGGAFEEFDHPGFTAQHVRESAASRVSCELYVDGVHCPACVWLIERLPRIVDGLSESRLDYARSRVRLQWNPERTSLSSIARGLDRLGYTPHPATESSQHEARIRSDRAALIRIGVAGACTGNVMLLASALYTGMFDGIDEGTRHGFRLLSAAIGLVCVLFPGRVFLRGALVALRTRSWHLDMPIALAICAGTISGIVSAVRGQGEIYFDSVTMLIFFLLFGRWLQERGTRSVADKLDLLHSFTPAIAHRFDEGVTTDVPTASLRAGDLVEVRPGELVPVDGVIDRGTSHVDQTVLTGEPEPVRVEPGACVSAGSVNVTSTLLVRTDAVGLMTRMGRIVSMIEEIGAERIPILGQTDRLARPFVITLASLSLICMLTWWHAGVDVAIEHTTALLIVVCPCALALASPLVVALAVRQAAQRGILIRGHDVFENLRKPGTVFLDKTGTVTDGRFEFESIHGNRDLLHVAAALERDAPHPIAHALRSFDEGLQCVDARHTPGAGVVGTVEGVRTAIGKKGFVKDALGPHACAFSPEPEQAESARVLIADERGRSAWIALGDRLRPDASDLVEALATRGWTVRMISGDTQDRVTCLSRLVGIETTNALGSLTPEEKLEIVRQESLHTTTLMVGDGVNDAAALAKASVGIAVSGGAEASLLASDVYLTDQSLMRITELIDGCEKAVRTIRRCILISLGYNLSAGGLALAGLIHPLVAAVLMPISSLTIVLMALGLRAFVPSKEPSS